MTLGADVAVALPELRMQGRSMMVDVGRFSRHGEPVFNPDTGLVEADPGVVVWEGPCRLRAPSAVELRRLFGEEQVTVARFVAAIPHDVVGIEVDDVLTFTASSDPEVLAREYRVVLVPAGTDLVLRSIGVEAVE